MLSTNQHVNTDFLKIIVNGNRIERVLSYKYLVGIIDERLTWKENCKRLSSTTIKYVDVVYKVKAIC